jgi:hypothetical protein
MGRSFLKSPRRGTIAVGTLADNDSMELIQYPSSPATRMTALPGPTLARVPSGGETEPQVADQALVVKRIDLLLELGGSLVRLTETATEEEQKPGRLAGSSYRTRLPLLIKQIELSVNALQALGGRPPETVIDLVEQPTLFGQQGSSLILSALDEINELIMSESIAPRRGRLSLQQRNHPAEGAEAVQTH